MLDKDINILIVGLGLIGGSYAARLSSLGYKVYGITHKEETRKYAVEHHYILDDVFSDEEKVSIADLIVFTAYPTIIPSQVEKYKPYYKKDVLLTDVSGTKGNLLKQVDEIIKGEFKYVSHHPMAGREKPGIENATPNMFLDANFVIISEEKNKQTELLEDLGNALGFKNISYLSAEKHDEVIGYLSQLTHAIAISLMNARDTEHMIKYTGDSFRDLTRIANINEKLWAELFFENRDILINEIDMFIKELSSLKMTLIENDRPLLEEKMKESTRRRKKFNK